MSLLDDVSIVVTPNGYKAGELYAVIPVPTEGAEEIDDGSFANDLDDWSKYGVTSATGGIATIGASANSGIYQGILTEGVRYTVTVNVTSYDGVGSAHFANNNGAVIYTITETGIQTFTFIHTISSSNLLLRGMSNALFSVSSVSVKEYTAADMDVTRATAATRVDEDGLVNYAQVISDTDLVTNGDFATDSDWSKGGNWSIGGGVATSNADGNSNISQNIPLTVGTDYSVTYTVVNASAGSRIGISTNATSIQIVRTTDGTYTETFTASLTSFYIRALWNNGSPVSVDNVSVKKVDLDNVPRIDYTGGGCPHILAEPQRTNLITYSEDFEDSYWTENDISVTDDFSVSPDGTQNASRITISGSTPHLKNTNISLTTGQVYTLSCFVKKGTNRWVRLSSVSSVSLGAWYDLENNVVGTVNSTSASIENYGNGWYRISNTITAINGVNQAFLGLSDDDNGTLSTQTGNTVFAWGFQVEQGSYPTSYIPTSGGTVTRNQDIFTRDGIGSLINSTEGVLFVEMAAFTNTVTSNYISLSDGSYNNRLSILFSVGTNVIRVFLRVGGVSQFDEGTTSYDITNFNKIAIKYKENDFALWVNGTKVATSASGLTIGAGVLTKLSFSEIGTSGGALNGKVKQLQVYNTALSDEQLLQLTGESGTDFYESYAEMASALTYTIQ